MQHTQSPQPPRDAVFDPVCGMSVDPFKARFRLTLQGQEYYFCAATCMESFARDPEKYLKHGPQGMPEHPTPSES